MQSGAPGEVSGRGRVLVVDDEPDLRRLVGSVLKASHEVMLAASGAEALELAARERFDAVVLDVTMPGMNGLEVCRALRERSPSYVAILLLTALDDAQSRQAGLEAGADDYLSKPFQRRELELRVQHFVRLAQQDRLIRTQVAALRELVALKDDLSALIVHDLRNPLTGVMTALSLLERDASLTPEVRDMARTGRFAASRVMDATKDLLQIRMLEADRLPLSLANVSVQEVVARAVEALKLTAERDGVELRLHAEGDATLPLDEKLVLRAVENLVMNAIRHTRGVVDVEVRRLPTRVVVAVADRGYGVPDELKSGLFDKFGSLELQKAGARRGHGLGLYLVRLVARAHGGEVDVDDREGGGASFRLVLPLSDA